MTDMTGPAKVLVAENIGESGIARLRDAGLDVELGTGWDRTYPGPEVPDRVVAGTRARYVEAFERLTEIPFERYLSDPKVVL